jgi:transcriptional regulator with XRE-family HTH domain
MDEAIERIRRRIRLWRDEQHLSLQELASRSGVAASSIQKVEHGQMVPSVGVFLKIARGLGRSVNEFFSEDPEPEEALFTAAKKHLTLDWSEGIRFERVCGDLYDPVLEAWRVWVEPGHGSEEGGHTYAGEQLVIGEEGEIRFSVDDTAYSLGPGDTLQFKATRPHCWRNEGDTQARFLIVGNSPERLREELHVKVPALARRT